MILSLGAVGRYYMPPMQACSRYGSSAHPPLQLHPKVPRPWVLVTYSTVIIIQRKCSVDMSSMGLAQARPNSYILRFLKLGCRNRTQSNGSSLGCALGILGRDGYSGGTTAKTLATSLASHLRCYRVLALAIMETSGLPYQLVFFTHLGRLRDPFHYAIFKVPVLCTLIPTFCACSHSFSQFLFVVIFSVVVTSSYVYSK